LIGVSSCQGREGDKPGQERNRKQQQSEPFHDEASFKYAEIEPTRTQGRRPRPAQRSKTRHGSLPHCEVAASVGLLELDRFAEGVPGARVLLAP
jgi:hypothetical protein